MWIRKNLKDRAKEVLKRNYWIPFLVCLMVAFISTRTGRNSTTSLSGVEYSGQNFEEIWSSIGHNLNFIPMYLLRITGLIAIGIGLFLKIFVINVLNVGKARFFLENRDEAASFKSVFKVFQEGHYLNIVKVMFVVDMKLFLWYLLLIVPGIVKTCEYVAIRYILAEDGSIGVQEAFEKTKRYTRHQRLDIFVVSLSFIGWWILGAFTFGILNLFVEPYVEATYTELYFTLKENASGEFV